MKTLITGGAGFIGSHLAERLLSRGDSVIVIDDLSTGNRDNLKHVERHPRFRCVIDTVMNRDVVDSLMEGCNVVYHLAAAVGVKLIMENPLTSFQTNIHGTEIVLEVAEKYGTKVMLASTSEVYGKNGKLPYSEDDDVVLGNPTVTRWNYAVSKAADEILAISYWRERALPVVICRFFNTVGPGQTGRYGMVIPRFVRQALSGKPITVYGDGKQTRCFSYVGDVIDGLIGLSECPAAVGEAFNIGNDKAISIEDLAKKVKELTNSTSLIVYIPYKAVYGDGFEDMMARMPNLTKIKELIGYGPKAGLDKILIEVIESMHMNYRRPFHMMRAVSAVVG